MNHFETARNSLKILAAINATASDPERIEAVLSVSRSSREAELSRP
jgi:hypothetical protein